MSYCQAGETARVTFPDGTKQDYPAPIDIKCENGSIPPEGRVRVDVCVSGSVTNTYSSFSETFNIERWSYNFSGYTIYTPILSSRIRADGNARYFEIYAYNTDSLSASPQWFLFYDWNASYQEANVSITVIKKRFSPDAGKDLMKKILTISRNGVDISVRQFDSCGFNVECVVPCSPNTLDCGDCCLDCATIFNQLSALTKKVLSIK